MGISMILFEIFKSAFYFALGAILTKWICKEECNKAVSDAYDIGYLKGIEEGRQ